MHNDYGYLYLGLHNLNIISQTPQRLRTFNAEKCANRLAHYAVVTLNYDIVLENLSKCISSNLNIDINPLIFVTEFDDEIQPFSEQPILAKLHGSIDLDNIVPPTWSKGVNRKILLAWRMAYRALVEATQIRIIGYSLPEADAYVKYLLKAAVMKAPHLKKFDVLCLDPDGEVQQRFDSFLKFPNYRFKNVSVISYLELNRKLYKLRGDANKSILEVSAVRLSD